MSLFSKAMEAVTGKSSPSENRFFKGTISNMEPLSARFITNEDVLEQAEIGPGDVVTEDEVEENIGSVMIPSTAIESYQWNPKTEEAQVRFKGGDTTYSFPNVPREVMEDWGDAQSKGKYYNAVVKQYSINN